jgi:hypothetical protein
MTAWPLDGEVGIFYALKLGYGEGDGFIIGLRD